MNKLKRHLHPQSTQAGFTIIESLMAMMVVSILMVALSPVVVLSVATRVQARRVELASQAARTYIDGVRAGVIPAPPLSQAEFNSIAAPRATGNLTCDPALGYYCTVPSEQVGPVATTRTVCTLNANPQCSSTESQNITVTTLYCVDLDDKAGCRTDSTMDMIVQAVGYHPNATDSDPKVNYDNLAAQGYELGIRVYRASAFKESGDLEKSKGDNSNQAGAAAGVFESQLPLLEITTAISPRQPSFRDLENLLDDS
ncbi:MAG: hormogonium polysaccharide secretion pseudopilin HpsB [Coleofasciculus chthonoplastes F3-SA18-01]|uniref:hormogonium polysaccharide secretion pseudopilin HpsB n=1 Tax=Coleofasciculus chthonoplastes TaxID=64178 RepID=UPI0032FB6477